MERRTWKAAALALVFLAACGKEEKTAATIAEDSALARDIAMAGLDSLAEPAMTDLSTGISSAEPPAIAPPIREPMPPIASEPVSADRPPVSRPTSPRSAVPAPAPQRNPSTRSAGRPRPPAPDAPAPLPQPATTEPAPVKASDAEPSPRAGGGRVIVPPSNDPSRRGRIAAGSSLALDAGAKVCTNTNRVGQSFNATVANSLYGTNGAAIPAGATAVVEITELKRASDDGDPIRMGFRVASVSFGGSTYPLDATATSASIARVKKRSSRQAEKIAGGAAVGAIAGQVLGKDTKSTVTGAAVGAVLGAAAGAASASTSSDGCVPSGGRINTVLNSSVRL